MPASPTCRACSRGVSSIGVCATCPRRSARRPTTRRSSRRRTRGRCRASIARWRIRTSASGWRDSFEQSGARATPSGIGVMMLLSAALCGLATFMFVPWRFAPIAAVVLGGFLPIGWLRHRRTVRTKKFEEGTVSRGARPVVARHPRRPRVPDRDGHDRRRGRGFRSGPSSRRRSISRTSACRCATRWGSSRSACRSWTSGSS